jgi:hypothetical protein
VGVSRLKQFKDRDGVQLSLGVEYAGFRKGTYVIIEIGATQSTVMKIRSGRGVPVHKLATTLMGNGWLRRIVVNSI